MSPVALFAISLTRVLKFSSIDKQMRMSTDSVILKIIFPSKDLINESSNFYAKEISYTMSQILFINQDKLRCLVLSVVERLY